MKPAIKAALISALIFPGLGHFTLKHGARGCLFLLPALLAAIYIFRQVLERASIILDQVASGALPLNALAISEQLSAASAANGPSLTVAATLGLACWAGSIIDSFMVGK